ncbi:hypothetical protein V8G54_010967 [Vigna mungo]|uniref:Uncharacterized protein n=1 Tax=Vigna mungo TaxID=3915 RepID=A0AAQ3NR15_VIGMU
MSPMRRHVSLNEGEDSGSDFVMKKERNGLNSHGSVFAVQGVFGVIGGGVDEHVVDIGIGESGDPSGLVLEKALVVQGSFEQLRDEGEEKVDENEAGVGVVGGVELGEPKGVVDGSHDLGVVGEVDVGGEGEGVAVEEVDVESVGGGVEVAVGEDAGGEEGEGEQGRKDSDSHGFLEKLPGERDVVVEADVGDETVCEVDGREGDPGGVEGGADLN